MGPRSNPAEADLASDMLWIAGWKSAQNWLIKFCVDSSWADGQIFTPKEADVASDLVGFRGGNLLQTRVSDSALYLSWVDGWRGTTA